MNSLVPYNRWGPLAYQTFNNMYGASPYVPYLRAGMNAGRFVYKNRKPIKKAIKAMSKPRRKKPARENVGEPLGSTSNKVSTTIRTGSGVWNTRQLYFLEMCNIIKGVEENSHLRCYQDCWF